jgi:Flp pilus assembly pilin Flp
MAPVARIVDRLVNGDDAQDLIEYALLVGLIALVAVIGVTSVGNTVSNVLWQTITTGLSGAL